MKRTLQKLILPVLMLLCSISAWSLPVNLTINLQDFAQQPLRSYVTVTLKTNGSCVLTTDTGVIGTAAKDYFPAIGSGSLTISITPQASILCGTTPSLTWYQIDVKQKDSQGNVTTVSSGKYQIPSSDSNLKDLPTYNTATPSPVANYAVRNGNNTFTGTQDFSNASVLGISGATAPRKFIPAETPDGSRIAFTLGATPSNHLAFHVYWNGIALTEADDYTISNNILTMTRAPKTGDHLFTVF